MTIIHQILLLIVGFAMLAKGADWFVDSSSVIAARLKIPQLVIGLTMGMSVPKAAVSINAAMKGNADIAIGNIVGSNILNILIILGLPSLIMPLAIEKSTIRIEIPFMIGVTLLLLGMGFDGAVGFGEGILLLLVFAAYLGYLFFMAKKNNRNEAKKISEMHIVKALIWIVGGIYLIVLGSSVTVNAATELARMLGLSDRFIGLTIVALGTSLPELFTDISVARKGNADITIGNIVGNNIFNILFVVGTSAVIVPVPFANGFLCDTMAAVFAAGLLWVFAFKGGKLRRWAGAVMILCYVAYFAVIC